MATVDLAPRARGEGNPGRKVYYIQNIVNIATAVTTKGSALAQGDVIEALAVPANTLILGGGIEVITAKTGTTADLTIDMGFTGGDVDAFVDGYDYDAAVAGAYATTVAANFPQVLAAADTIDLLLVTMTGTLLTGKIRVWALVCDIDDTTDRFGSAAARDATV